MLEQGPPGAWDFNETISAHVLPTGIGYEMWYSGYRFGARQHLGYATSPDGIAWTRHEANPVFEAPAWTDPGIVYPSVLREGDTYRMWFQGWQSASASIGYATAPAAVATEPPATPSAASMLLPPRPNPTTAGTTLHFHLARPAHVVLTIHDLLGREVVRLVDEAYEAGQHEVVFDPDRSLLPRGVYVVRLEAGGATQTRRVTLLR